MKHFAFLILFVIGLSACTKDGSPEPASVTGSEKAAPKAETPVCVVGGCSNERCLSEAEAKDLMSTCEWRDEYKCRQLATCEAQPNGQCGFTETEASRKCMEEFPKDEAKPAI